MVEAGGQDVFVSEPIWWADVGIVVEINLQCHCGNGGDPSKFKVFHHYTNIQREGTLLTYCTNLCHGKAPRLHHLGLEMKVPIMVHADRKIMSWCVLLTWKKHFTRLNSVSCWCWYETYSPCKAHVLSPLLFSSVVDSLLRKIQESKVGLPAESKAKLASCWSTAHYRWYQSNHKQLGQPHYLEGLYLCWLEWSEVECGETWDICCTQICQFTGWVQDREKQNLSKAPSKYLAPGWPETVWLCVDQNTCI